MVRLRLLGGASLEDDAGPRKGPVVQRHRIALLALLALVRGPGISRDRILALLWPERDAPHGRNLLNQAAHVVRRSLGKHALVKAGDRLVLAPGSLDCDATAFEDAIAAGDPEGAVELYGGPLLEGFHLPEAPEFEAWLESERERLRRMYLRGLEQSAGTAEARDDWAAAAERWRRLTAEDPYNARLTLRLMNALDAGGDRAGAIRQAANYAASLKRDLDAEPDPGVIRLAQTLRAAGRTSGQRVLPGEAEDRLGSTGASAGPVRLRNPTFVGRAAEFVQLQDAWRAAETGGPRFAWITGEAGMGKTRLADEFLGRLARRGIVTARARCYRGEGRLAYAPVADWLRSGELRSSLEGLDAGCLVEVARLLPELHGDHLDLPDPEPLTEAWQRQRLFAALARAVLADGTGRVLLADDLHWCDTDTIQWLRYLLRFDIDARLLVVGTARTEELPQDHAMEALLLDLRREDRVVEIALGSLAEQDTAELAARVAGRALDPSVAAALHRDTQGIPLFVVETIRARLIGGDAPPCDGAAGGTPTPVEGGDGDAWPPPPRVRAIIESRFAQLSPPARELLGVAAVAGREFTFDLLVRATELVDDAAVAVLEELCHRRILREHAAGSYEFTHDRLHEEAYRGIGSARRLVLHRRVARTLEELHTPDLDRVSGEVASHHELGGEPERAVACYRRAADMATGVLAYDTAASHLKRALALVASIPRSEDRDRTELALHTAMALTRRFSRGWAAPEVGEGLARALRLCRELGDADELFRVLVGLQSFRFVEGSDLRGALELLEETGALATTRGDAFSLVAFHLQAGSTLCQIGAFATSLEHLNSAVQLYDHRRHLPAASFYGGDFGVLSHAFAGHVLWHLGDVDDAKRRCRQAIALADRLEHPFSRAVARAYDAMLHAFLDDAEAVKTGARATLDLTRHYGFSYYDAWAVFLLGWATTRLGDAEEGIEEMKEGLARLTATGASLRGPYYLGLLGEAVHRAGRPLEGLRLVDQALAVSAKTGEKWRDAELHYRRGEILLACEHDAGSPEAALQKAVSVARKQGARALEARARERLATLAGVRAPSRRR